MQRRFTSMGENKSSALLAFLLASLARTTDTTPSSEIVYHCIPVNMYFF